MYSIVNTDDGSHSLYAEHLKEQYHSKNGAINESNHVFIQAGLHFAIKHFANIHILEIGLGTGLNTILSLKENKSLHKNIQYNALEPFPIQKEIAQQLNYVSLLGSEFESAFEKIHSDEWGKEIELAPNFHFKKLLQKLEDWENDKKYNLIYFDAFSPATQPELWTKSVFEKIAGLLMDNGCLVTYCAKGEVKRLLKSAGLVVESLPGPIGKREMVRAIKHL